MTVSLPSREIYVVDVPEVGDFRGEFHYNFFAPDESVSEIGGIPRDAIQRASTEIDDSFIQYATTRVPRFVVFKYTPPRISDGWRLSRDSLVRANAFGQLRTSEALIADNLDKIVDEDSFATHDFTTVNFQDGEIDDKVYQFVSGSYAQRTIDEAYDPDVAPYRASMQLYSSVDRQVKPHFLMKAMAQSQRSSGTRFFSPGGKRIVDRYFTKLKSIAINAQLNSRLVHDIIDRSVRDPNSQFTSELHTLHRSTKSIQRSAQSRFKATISEDDFKTFVPFIDIKVPRMSQVTEDSEATLVGFVIDKLEVLPDGGTKTHQPIIIENPRTHMTADFQIKYGTSYVYTIRTIALFTIPAIDDDTGDIASLKVLISSKPSAKVFIKTTENVAPPPPNDLKFNWDYENDRLMVHWTFPTTTQRDVKKFQVFRRLDTDHPFELIKMYDFDDSQLKYPNQERPRRSLIEDVPSAVTWYFDDDFKKENSKFIYAVASVDAHGYTSAYSAQFEVSYDIFKNQVVTKMVSHSGAPKPYPNLYLNSDTFVDTIRVSGEHSKRMKVYFNPEYYHLEDDSGRFIRTIATAQTGGSYKLQFINIDNQKSRTIDITVDDRTRAATRTLGFPNFRFGPKRRVMRTGSIRKISAS